MVHALPTPDDVAELAAVAARVRAAMESVITGRPDLVRHTVAVLLAEGHLLIEDVPGVGKTTLAKALAHSIDGSVGRIQFTPDLLPSDLTGVSIYRQSDQRFEFRPGPVFANVVIGDEINRASPKTQSALLECMQEAQVTIDGVTHPLPRPFLVVATQNPVEMEGTYALPEAQRDRFMARLHVGYPSAASELDMLERQEESDPLGDLTPVTDARHLSTLIGVARRLHASTAVKEYVVALAAATRQDPMLRLGASPRAAIQLLRAAKALAAMSGRDHVLPDDVQELAIPVLAHRLLPSSDARLAGHSVVDSLRGVLASTSLPAGASAHRPHRATG
ncbi:MAG TPA: AAA family ATPase [Actinotalea sp.]|nr:AAA family ATPase [Actinotalea sp.]